MNTHSVDSIPLALIDVPAGRRKLDPTWVAALAENMQAVGLQQAIEVIDEGGRYRLVFGNHRLAAAAHLGWDSIPAAVKDAAAFADAAAVTLREISENFVRRQLSALDRAVDIARWRDIYEAGHRLDKGGRRKLADAEELSAKFALSFSEAAQKTFDLSRRSIFLAVKIAGIRRDVRDLIALHAIADNQSELLMLAEETGERQMLIAGLLTSEPAQRKDAQGRGGDGRLVAEPLTWSGSPTSSCMVKST